MVQPRQRVCDCQSPSGRANRLELTRLFWREHAIFGVRRRAEVSPAKSGNGTVLLFVVHVQDSCTCSKSCLGACGAQIEFLRNRGVLFSFFSMRRLTAPIISIKTLAIVHVLCIHYYGLLSDRSVVQSAELWVPAPQHRVVTVEWNATLRSCKMPLT